MDAEYMSILENNTWTVVDPPRGAQRMRGKRASDYNSDANAKITR